MKFYKLAILTMTLLFLSGSFDINLFGFNIQAKYILLISSLFVLLFYGNKHTNTKNIMIPRNLSYLFIVSYILYLLLIVSFFYNDNLDNSVNSLIDMFISVILIVIVSLYVFMIEKDNFFNYLSGLLILIGIAYIIPVYLGVLSGSGRGASLGGPNVSTRVIFFAACCSMYRYKITQKFIYSVLSLLFFCGIVFIGSRGGLVGAIATLFVMWMCHYVIKRWRIKKNAKIKFSFKKIFMVIIGIGVIFYLYEPLKRVYESRIASTLFSSEGVYTAGRDLLYIRAIEMIKEKPIIGHGLNGFATSSLYNYPHNFLLELMVDIGFIGAIFFIILLAFAINIIIRYRNKELYIFSGIPLYMIIVQMFSGGLYDFRYYFFWAIPLLYYAGKPSLVTKITTNKQTNKIRKRKKYKIVW